MDGRMGAMAKPAIKIFYRQTDQKQPEFLQLLYGIEEEGIPFELWEHKEGNETELSYLACQESRLGVGLGVSGGRAALHYEKLDREKPLFRIQLTGAGALIRARALGANAARLVKQMPLKTI